jgi:hypothetical protein
MISFRIIYLQQLVIFNEIGARNKGLGCWDDGYNSAMPFQVSPDRLFHIINLRRKHNCIDDWHQNQHGNWSPGYTTWISCLVDRDWPRKTMGSITFLALQLACRGIPWYYSFYFHSDNLSPQKRELIQHLYWFEQSSEQYMHRVLFTRLWVTSYEI